MNDTRYETDAAAVSEEALSAGGAALTPEETDTLGEVGNICMGAVATTMYMLMDRRVEITTPRVSVHTTRDMLSMYPIPFVIVEVEYTEGITGKNLLLLKEYDAAVITDVLMGGEGTVEEPIELTELHMSAINEIMNQMIGASATALAQVIGCRVDISPPVSRRRTLEPGADSMLGTDDVVIVITFDMEIEGLLMSQLIQFIPYDQGRSISAMLTGQAKCKQADDKPAQPAAAPSSAGRGPAQIPDRQPLRDRNDIVYAYPRGGPDLPAAEQPRRPRPGDLVDVRRLRFEPFDDRLPKERPNSRDDLSRINNIPLAVSAKLGTARRTLSEILAIEPGTVIMLDKVAGDPVEILVNGKLVAAGEVVVIDENYGVRVTELYGK